MKKSGEQTISGQSRIHVLVAEDDPINMMIAVKILESKSFKVLHAPDGQEAVKILDEGTYTDIVLLDLEMPKMSGYVAVEIIKGKFPLLPVIACTANLVDKSMHATLLQLGFVDTISKPFNTDMCIAKIYAALKRQIV